MPKVNTMTEYFDVDRLDFERKLLKQNIQTAQVLGTAITMRDHGTGAHNLRVALYSGAFGEALGFDQTMLRNLIAGAFLHDIGKIAIPDTILLKAGKLSDDEELVMREHCRYGAQLIEKLPAFHSALPVVLHHHEQYDGNGYPSGLVGERIPIIARVFAIIDVFDALVSARPYKQALSWTKAVTIIDTASGTHFDPRLTAQFLDLVPTVYLTLGNLTEEELQPHATALRRRYFGI
jgi:HD-GYP domain